RFPNDPVQIGSRLHWDILRLYHEIKQGIRKAAARGEKLKGLAIDSWAVDFGLLDRNGELLGNPYHYRDRQTDGMMERFQEQLGAAKLFRSTGIQFLPFNTVYQLAALKKRNSSLLEQAETLLMIPDLLRYFLTGERKMEFTNASTTQLFNPETGDCDNALLDHIGISNTLFPEIVKPGTQVGRLRKEIADELGIESIPVYAVGEHDTASAVAAV